MTTAAAFDEFVRVVEAACPPMPQARFALGQIVRCTAAPFRGVIVDVDPSWGRDEATYQKLEAYDPVGYARDQPWYQIIGEFKGEPGIRYIAERMIEADDSGQPVRNAVVGDYFGRFLGDHYAFNPRIDA